MHQILTALIQDNTVKEIADAFSFRRETLVYGIADSQKTAVFAAAYAASPKPAAIIVPNREALSLWFDDLAELLPEADVVEYPEVDLIDVNAAVKSLERIARRMSILERLLNGEKFIVLATATAAIKKSVSRTYFASSQLKISLDDVLQRDRLFDKLIDFGYERAEPWAIHGAWRDRRRISVECENAGADRVFRRQDRFDKGLRHQHEAVDREPRGGVDNAGEFRDGSQQCGAVYDVHRRGADGTRRAESDH